MDKDLNTRKRKKSVDDAGRSVKKSMKNGSGSEEEDEDLFSWEEYLKKCHSKAVPKESFKHVQDTKVQGFVPGMKLECMDRTSLETDTYWVATVVMASGPLLLLRHDGYDDDRSGDFWCDAASEELQPIGWCRRTNNILIPPAAIRHKESNWATFLKHDLKNAVCAPEHLFHRRSDPNEENQLKPGLKLELLHADDPLCYWVASIVDSYGLRLRLRLEGSEDESDDAWVYFLSDNVHQLGWGKKNKLRLNVPSVLKTKYPSKDWAQVRGRLLGLCNLASEDASLNKALNKSDSLPTPHGFTAGVKLEAVNPKDPSSICAATVSKVVNQIFFQVEIDSMISCGDAIRPSMWCSSISRNIFPVGWCEKNNIQLTPPPGYLVHPFRWQTYLEFTKSSAAPDLLFNSEIPSHEFDISMKLEAVDQTEPSTMTVATVTQVVGRTMWVLLDGYKNDSVEHIYDVESFDLYPVGWCSMNGHPLLTPRIQRCPEENRRLASLRTTRQREIKKTASDTNVTNTTNTSNDSAANDLNTDIPMNPEITPEETLIANNVTSAQGTNHSHSPVFTKDNKPVVNVEPSSKKKEKSEGAKNAKPRSETTEGPTTPKRKYDFRQSTLEQQKRTVIDLTKDEDCSGVCIYVNKSCEPGPFLKQTTIDSFPPVIGPAGPNVVLRQLVEQIVSRAHSSKQVLKLLASETDKMTFSRIIKTLKTKLSMCENFISFNRVALCSQCNGFKGVCIYVKKSCKPSPLLKQTKIGRIPRVIGPAGPKFVLRQLVEQIVLSAHSSKQVLKLLASERDVLTLSSAIKRITTILSLCENQISLERNVSCGHCDAVKESFNPDRLVKDTDPTVGIGPTVAVRSVPRELKLQQSTIPGAGRGIFADVPIPEAFFFGPYKGEKRVGREVESSVYRWRLRKLKGNRIRLVDASDENKSNWMRFVNTTLDGQSSANLKAFPHKGDVYYKTTRPLLKGEELLVYYGKEYVKDMLARAGRQTEENAGL